DYFLCGDCESRFSRSGEHYVLSQCARWQGFKLQSLLKSSVPIAMDEECMLYDASVVLSSKVDQYLYFAASVFWRAAARSWTLNGREIERLSIEDRYEEDLRQYLLKQAPFPNNGRIFLQVWGDKQIDFTTIPPCSYQMDGFIRYK